jgi:hypothetical protein
VTPPSHPGSPETATVTKAPRRPRPRWVWGVVGGAAGLVVVGLAVGLGVGLSGTTYPAAATMVTVR